MEVVIGLTRCIKLLLEESLGNKPGLIPSVFGDRTGAIMVMP